MLLDWRVMQKFMDMTPIKTSLFKRTRKKEKFFHLWHSSKCVSTRSVFMTLTTVVSTAGAVTAYSGWPPQALLIAALALSGCLSHPTHPWCLSDSYLNSCGMGLSPSTSHERLMTPTSLSVWLLWRRIILTPLALCFVVLFISTDWINAPVNHTCRRNPARFQHSLISHLAQAYRKNTIISTIINK